MHIAAARLLEQWQRYVRPDTETEWHLATARRKLSQLVVLNLRRIDASERLSSADLTMAQAVDLHRALHGLGEEYDDTRRAFVAYVLEVVAPSVGFDGQQVEGLRHVFEPSGDDRVADPRSHDIRPRRPGPPRSASRHEEERGRLVDRRRRRKAHA